MGRQVAELEQKHNCLENKVNYKGYVSELFIVLTVIIQ
jgi:hypothetical protein